MELSELKEVWFVWHLRAGLVLRSSTRNFLCYLGDSSQYRKLFGVVFTIFDTGFLYGARHFSDGFQKVHL